MTRWILGSLVAVVVGGYLVGLQFGVDPYELLEQASYRYHVEKFDQEMAERRRPQMLFHQTLAKVRQDLGAGSSSLRDSCREIEQAAERYFPAYFSLLESTTEGDDREEKIARQLVHYLREESPSASLGRVERELKDIILH